MDRHGRYVFVSRAYAARFGVPAGDLVGRYVRDVLGAARAEVIEPSITTALGGARVEFESEIDFPVGGRATVQVTYEPEVDQGGTVTGFIASVADVTARVRVEEALRESDATVRAFFDSAPACMGLVELTSDGDILHIDDNAAACRFFGVAPEGTRGRRASALGLNAHTIATWRASYLDSAARSETVRFDHGFDGPDGRRWMLISVRPVASSARHEQRFCYVADDITVRKRSEEALASREAELRTLADGIAQFAWTADATGWIYWYNRRWFEYTGTTLAEMEGWGWRAVHHPDHVDRVVERFAGCISSGAVWEDVFPLRARDGSYRWFLSRAVPLRDADGTVSRWFGTNTDITAQLDAETALREADRRKDEFLATLAHELRNPLSPMRNALEVMRLTAVSDPHVSWGRDVIARQVGQLARLVDDLLDLSRVSRGHLELRREPLVMADVLATAVEMARPLMQERRQRFTMKLPDEPIRMFADPVRLAQVFGNLLHNSAKYTEAEGSISLRATAADGVAEIRVCDDGIGIPADMLPRVFDMFTQVERSLDRRAGGLGIGLTLVRQLVELHGGTVAAHSDGLGRGSEFVVRLPLTAESGYAKPAAVETPAAPARLRILVADDNADNAESLSMLLGMLGHEVRTALDGREALTSAEAFQPDVALLDIGMPELDGYAVCRAIRARPWGSAPRLIALTGWGQDEDRQRTRAAGFDHHLTKPLEYAELERLLAGGRPAADER